MLCTEIVFDIQYTFCTQHVLQKEELLTKISLYFISWFLLTRSNNQFQKNNFWSFSEFSFATSEVIWNLNSSFRARHYTYTYVCVSPVFKTQIFANPKWFQIFKIFNSMREKYAAKLWNQTNIECKQAWNIKIVKKLFSTGGIPWKKIIRMRKMWLVGESVGPLEDLKIWGVSSNVVGVIRHILLE